MKNTKRDTQSIENLRKIRRVSLIARQRYGITGVEALHMAARWFKIFGGSTR